MDNAKNIFSQNHISIVPENREKGYSFYSLENTKQMILEIVIESNLGGEQIEIAHFTDVHINYCEEEDFNDSEIAYTYQKREWLKDAVSLRSLEKSLEVAKFCDKTVITGDILDYLSIGAKNLAIKRIFEHDKNIVCTIGGHELKKQMQTGLDEQLPLEERYNILREFWCNDITYHSEVLKDKVILVALDNSQGKYYKEQIEKLKKDISTAKSENKIILLFQHEPIYTSNPEDCDVKPVWAKLKENYNFLKCAGNPQSDDTTKEMHDLITRNSDVIRGVFCGHLHEFFYTEIKTQTGYIPQFVCPANPYNNQVGIVGRIIIK